MKKSYYFFLLMFCISFTRFHTSFAQTNLKSEEEKTHIEVIGTAEKEVIPDEIYITINLKERYSGREKITIEAQEEKLKTGLKEIGVDLANLSLSDANAFYIRARLFTKDVMARKGYVLKVSDAVTVGKVFDVLEKNEISDAGILKVNHSKIDALRKEVRIMAIKAAKDKADYLLAAIGEQAGKALVVQERDYISENVNSNVNIRGSRSSGSIYFVDGVKMLGQEDSIEFQKIKLQYSIYVKFGIK